MWYETRSLPGLAGPLPLVLAALVGCGGAPSGSPSQLPEQRPSDLEIRLFRDEGMIDIGRKIRIDPVEATFEERNEGARCRFAFEPLPRDLDELYAALRDLRCDRVESRREEVWDRGGTTLCIEAAGRSHCSEDSGRDFVKEEWAGTFARCLGTVERFVERHRVAQGRPCEEPPQPERPPTAP